MTIEKLQELIAGGGVTLNAQGEAVSYPKGYQVALTFQSKELPADNMQAVCNEVAVKMLLMDELSAKTGYPVSCGVWVHEGVAFVEFSVHVLNYQEAMTIARNGSQYSIWWWEGGKELKTC